MKRNIRPILFALAVLAAPGAALAAADTNSSGGPVDPVLERAALHRGWRARQPLRRG